MWDKDLGARKKRHYMGEMTRKTIGRYQMGYVNMPIFGERELDGKYQVLIFIFYEYTWVNANREDVNKD